MRVFTKLRSFYALNEKFERKVNRLEKDVTHVFKVIFERLENLENATPTLRPNRKKIGLKVKN
jgi:hypothetical protein